MDHGIHVLCEKPFAIDLDHAKMMLAASKRNCVAITMASKFRYVDDVVRAKSIVTSGILGELVLFENAFTSRVDMTTLELGSGHQRRRRAHRQRHALGRHHALLPRPARRRPGRRRQAHAGPAGGRHRAHLRAQPKRRDGQHRPVVEHQQGAGSVHQHLRLARHDPGRLERIEVPPIVEPRLDRVRQGLRQGPGAARAGRQLRARHRRRRALPHHGRGRACLGRSHRRRPTPRCVRTTGRAVAASAPVAQRELVGAGQR